MESFRFAVRKQYTSHLCCRSAPVPPAPGTPPLEAAAPGSSGADGRYSGRMSNAPRLGGGAVPGSGSDPVAQQQAEAGEDKAPVQGGEGTLHAAAGRMDVESGAPPAAAVAVGTNADADAEGGTPRVGAVGTQLAEAHEAGQEDDQPLPPQDFGFPHLVSMQSVTLPFLCQAPQGGCSQTNLQKLGGSLLLLA